MINKISPLPQFLVNRYSIWKNNSFVDKSEKFKMLAKSGQSPSSMIISCCDSRVNVTSILGADEGEFFIHRNIANLVPPFMEEGQDSGTHAAIEYAIIELKVRHLIILGHTQCGGIKGSFDLYNGKKNTDYVHIYKWLNTISKVFNKIEKNISEQNKIKQLEEESIKNSINNLFTFPKVKIEVEKKKLSVHGLIFNISTGQLKYLNPVSEKFDIL